jgi:hypothetical protein
VKRFVYTRRQAPISRNEFIRLAIEEKLDHLRRSSRRGRRRSKGRLRGAGNTAKAGKGLPVDADSRGSLAHCSFKIQ